MKSLLIHGRQPAFGRAELESLYGPDKLEPFGRHVTIVDIDPCLLAFDRLGGSSKFCKLLTILPTTDWQQIENFLLKVSPDHSRQMPEGKMLLGLSVIGLPVNLKRLQATGLKLKKVIRSTGRPVRLVPNKEAELNSAQVIHNKLTSPNGWELVFIADGKQTIIAQTVKVQDIEAYARRDQQRPKRDTRVGMLPPKLAQIIINLATDKIAEDRLESICDIPAGTPVPVKLINKTLLDPFCGTGVILQEATLMGYHPYGSDIESRMIDYTDENLIWLINQTNGLKPSEGLKTRNKRYYRLEVGDATKHYWEQRPDLVAAELYLGRPLNKLPDQQTLRQIISDCNQIIKKFMQNIHPQLKPGTRLCLAVPAWYTKKGFQHLPLIDSLGNLGYNQLKFVHISNEELIYHRPNQTVARELLVLERK